MDEEDGRLGPRAQKFGRFDVLTDASATSLCFSTDNFQWALPESTLRFGPVLRDFKDLTPNEVIP